ncbi:MAG: hypothetical protein PHR66_02570 [Desulfuromonadaceae bacterium]|nr:hypothetical protein [Desulfuromonadaceae bacterium]
MKSLLRLVFVVLFAVFMLTACLVSPGPGGYGVVVAPPLPAIVEFSTEPYYYQSGYHYFYQNNNWQYSRDRNGPRMELPRDRWPKEIRYKGRGDHGRELKRDHEDR